MTSSPDLKLIEPPATFWLRGAESKPGADAKYVAFASLGDLAAALQHHPLGEPFLRKAWLLDRVAGGRVAGDRVAGDRVTGDGVVGDRARVVAWLPAREMASFESAERTHTWRAAPCQRPESAPLDIGMLLLQSATRRFDPGSLVPSSSGTIVRPGGLRCAGIWPDIDSPHQEYVFVARGAAPAQHLVRILTAVRATPLDVLPLARGVATGGEPALLVLVRGALPPRAAVDAAWKVFWGRGLSLRKGKARLFIEWPFGMDLPESHLDSCAWPDGTGIVLLSADGATLVVATPTPGLRRLESAADLAVRALDVAEPRAAAEFETKLVVDLRLTTQPWRERAQARIDELRRDVATKNATIAALELELVDEEGTPRFAREALYLYVTSRGELPWELQRLLVDWSDQDSAGGLRALRYGALQADSLPDDLADRPDVDVHVLVTEGGLNVPGTGTTAASMQPYRPRAGPPGSGGRAFAQLSEWAKYGLRVFVDAGQHLLLYPPLRPSQAAADKLGAALVQGNGDYRDYLFLLREARGSVVATALRRDLFRELATAFEWQCDLVVTPPAAPVQQRLASAIVPTARDAVASAFESAVRPAAQAAVDARRDQIQKELERANQDLSAMRANAREILQQKAKQEGALRSARADLLVGGRVLRTIADRLRTGAADLEKLEAELSEVLDVVKDLRARSQFAKGNGKAGHP